MWSLIAMVAGAVVVAVWYICAFVFFYICGRAQAAKVSFDAKFCSSVAALLFLLATVGLVGVIVWSDKPIVYAVMVFVAAVSLSVISLHGGRRAVRLNSPQVY